VLASAASDHPELARRPGSEVAPHLDRARAWASTIAGGGMPGGQARPDALRWISYLELKQRLPEMLLTRLDKMTMAHGVEGRVPFLDHELVTLLMALPASLRVRGGVPKYLLKRAAERWLPPEIVDQPKRGFGAPVARWLRGQLGQQIELQVAESGLVRNGLLRGEAIHALIDRHRAGRAAHGQAIWSLYVLCRWHDLMLAPARRSGPRPVSDAAAAV
jgi:asparagine synthase (glutamine-hydrolysing)